MSPAVRSTIRSGRPGLALLLVVAGAAMMAVPSLAASPAPVVPSPQPSSVVQQLLTSRTSLILRFHRKSQTELLTVPRHWSWFQMVVPTTTMPMASFDRRDRQLRTSGYHYHQVPEKAPGASAQEPQ